ncbi:MAG: zinc ribbon domain-containing protein [Chloroflexi bacterium]|nr:zinc ribbon domain-containing protein [Chloroflexota bacterium]
MPVYTYRREDGTTFDMRQKFGDRPLNACPTTGQIVKRVIQPAGIIFKGSGFYVNDNNKAKNPAKPAGASENGKSADKAAKPKESKPDSPTASKSEKRESALAAN